MNLRRASACTIVGLAVLAGGVSADEAPADEAPTAGWEADLEDARDRARSEGKLVLQFRLIGDFSRLDC